MVRSFIYRALCFQTDRITSNKGLRRLVFSSIAAVLLIACQTGNGTASDDSGAPPPSVLQEPSPGEPLLSEDRIKEALSDTAFACLRPLYSSFDYSAQWHGSTDDGKRAALDSMRSDPMRFGLVAVDGSPFVSSKDRVEALLPDSLRYVALSDELANTLDLYALFYVGLKGKWPKDVLGELCRDSLMNGHLQAILKEDTPYKGLLAEIPAPLSDYIQWAHDYQRDFSMDDEPAEITPWKTDSLLCLEQTRSALMGSGWLTLPDSTADRAKLDSAIRNFQQLHGLEPDGIPGSRTVAEIQRSNVSRLGTIFANIERERDQLAWGRTEDLLEVNIPEFKLHVHIDGEEVAEHKVIVGVRKKHQTPVFHASLSSMVFNPQWVVPYSIATKELLPAQRRDPTYFYRNDFIVYDRNNNTVNPSDVNWKEVSASNFPYRIVQKDGCDNALGQVKFLFPNQYSVYLHDTPSRHLFQRTERDFSHGCIRVQNPYRLSRVLLEAVGSDEVVDSVDFYSCVNDSDPNYTIRISPGIQVFVLYRTVRKDVKGNWIFYPDLYGRDLEWIRRTEQAFSK